MAERLMINEQLRICESKAEIPVAAKSKRSRLRERDAATENKILQHVLSIVGVGARHSNWIIKRAQINSIGVFNASEMLVLYRVTINRTMFRAQWKAKSMEISD